MNAKTMRTTTVVAMKVALYLLMLSAMVYFIGGAPMSLLRTSGPGEAATLSLEFVVFLAAFIGCLWWSEISYQIMAVCVLVVTFCSFQSFILTWFANF